MQFFQVVLASAAITTASAFLAASPQSNTLPSSTNTITALNAASPQTKTTSSSASASDSDLNGWVPDESKFAFGLPGTLDPVADGFDPLGFAKNADLQQMKGYREAETTHGRVAMLAVVGFLVTEGPISFHPLFDTASKDIGPAIRHLDEVRAAAPFFFEILAIVIGYNEIMRSLVGWEQPGNKENLALKTNYYPGKYYFSFRFVFCLHDTYTYCIVLSSRYITRYSTYHHLIYLYVPFSILSFFFVIYYYR